MKHEAKRFGRLAAFSVAGASTLTLMAASPAAADTDLYTWNQLSSSITSGTIVAQLWMGTETTGRFARIGFGDSDTGAVRRQMR